jgi:catechol 2,3-dioxygenase-like lactoylglutathione lyase family enzyme
MPDFTVKAIDHVVLTVKDIQATVAFYSKRLGMKHEVFVSQGVER